MKALKFDCLQILILIVSASCCIAKFYLKYSCFQRWNHDHNSCWHTFNHTDYCDAVHICRFYGSLMANNQSGVRNNPTSSLWVYNATIKQLLINVSCSSMTASMNDSQYLCPLESPTGVTMLSNCSSTEKFICTSAESPVEVGLKSGKVKDYQISSSSVYHSLREPIGYKAKFGRLHYKYLPGTATQGGWCSRRASGVEFFQVNFDRVVLVTGLVLQGVTSRQCSFWVTLFNVRYKPNAEKWVVYRNGSVDQVFVGNKDAYQTKEIHFNRSFVAQAIRLHPMAFGNTCNASRYRYCLRLEIYALHLKVFSDAMVRCFLLP